MKQKKMIIFVAVVVLILILVAAGICILYKPGPVVNKKYACTIDFDCASTCNSGCVNIEWKKGHKDSCINKRAYDCSCVNNICYSDGKSPKEIPVADSCNQYCAQRGYKSGNCFDCVYLDNVELPKECTSDKFFAEDITWDICTEVRLKDNTRHGCLCK